jgi:hypothetical protein
MDLGEPIKRYTAVPLENPVTAPEPQQKPAPTPTRREKTPAREPERVDG